MSDHPQLANARLYQHPYIRDAYDISGAISSALERAERNGIDALDSDDPVNELCRVGWEQDCYLEPSARPEDGYGHLDCLLIDLIRDARRYRREGWDTDCAVDVYERVLRLGERLIEWMRHSDSAQTVAIHELQAEREANDEDAQLVRAGVVR